MSELIELPPLRVCDSCHTCRGPFIDSTSHLCGECARAESPVLLRARVAELERDITMMRDNWNEAEQNLAASQARERRLREACERIANWPDEDMSQARTLHYDMRGWARAALADAQAEPPCPCRPRHYTAAELDGDLGEIERQVEREGGGA